MFRRQKSSIMLSTLFCLSCGQPTRDTRPRITPAPPSPLVEPELDAGSEGSRAAWQRIKVRIEAKRRTASETLNLIGYDQVAPILGRKEYACFGCHTSEWPYLSRKGGWPRLMESLGDPAKPAVTTKEELAAIIVGCMDVATEDYCAGDPKDTGDTLAAKMPTKFGRKKVSEDDMAILRKWVTDGAPELSSVPGKEVELTNLVSFEAKPAEVDLIDLRQTELGQATELASRDLLLEVRPRGSTCEPGSLKITLRNASGGELSQFTLPLSCDAAGQFTYNSLIQL